MPPAYNPIVRTFCRVRAVLVSALGVDHRQVRPTTSLDALIPQERRGEVLARLRQAGLDAPDLERQVVARSLCGIAIVVVPAAVIIPLLLGSWVAFLVALPVPLVLVLLASRVTRRRVVQVPMGARTVGELVIFLTRFGDHPGYRFSRAEISLKVRFIIAEWLGVPVSRVQEKSTFINLESW